MVAVQNKSMDFGTCTSVRKHIISIPTNYTRDALYSQSWSQRKSLTLHINLVLGSTCFTPFRCNVPCLYITFLNLHSSISILTLNLLRYHLPIPFFSDGKIIFDLRSLFQENTYGVKHIKRKTRAWCIFHKFLQVWGQVKRFFL